MNSGAGAELVRCVKEYFKKMLSESGSGMKVLLVDSETMEIVTAVYTQSEILAKEVFLVEKLELSEEQGESMLHMKAVCFVRPTSDNLAHLKRHLRTPKYGEYHLFFSNMVRDGYLQQLAEADEGELVRQVQEYFADYCALDSSHFTVPVADPSSCFLPPNRHPQATQHTRDRMVQGIASVLLSLKRRPIIRYQESSENSRSVAGDVYRLVYEQEAALFDFRHSPGSTVLLIIDRLDDPVTPLLSQWTYQAMVHELIGIKGHRVDLRHVPKVPPEQKEVVLNAERDEFFKEHVHANYGDLGLAVKAMVDEFQLTSKSNQNISSIEDMQRFVENYPEFRAKSGNVSKHVAVLSELNRLIDARQLMQVSCTEQELACSSSAPKDHCAEVKTMLEDPAVLALPFLPISCSTSPSPSTLPLSSISLLDCLRAAPSHDVPLLTFPAGHSLACALQASLGATSLVPAGHSLACALQASLGATSLVPAGHSLACSLQASLGATSLVPAGHSLACSLQASLGATSLVPAGHSLACSLQASLGATSLVPAGHSLACSLQASLGATSLVPAGHSLACALQASLGATAQGAWSVSGKGLTLGVEGNLEAG
ncbi:vacuolar protein sorting-associated protein 45 [Cymbomonas tetramitiformis]|uniref:Vacuolar protein sorting-associated protein 45 n=1 Tax=Cymbomonas tetramitiformis TaxID=36881 RepID=A0AAE0FJ99_9CHLO|nr:vacuolar protein sorting-associated protein 45 [Cymbomonas tetramitiformis]